MAKCQISSQLPSLIDPTRTPIAYGDHALPRMNDEMKGESLLLKQRALRSLSDHLHDPEHIATAINIGAMGTLRDLFLHKDNTVRELATECVCLLVTHAIGREAVIDSDVIPNVAVALNDSELVVRRNAHLILKNLSITFIGAEAVVEAGLIYDLVQKVRDEHEDILLIILDTLHFLLKIDTNIALENDAIAIMTHFLNYENPEVRAKSARDIMDLSVPLKGKNLAVELGTLIPLIDLLRDPEPDIRAYSAAAIMFITITTKGKYQAISHNSIPALLDLVDDRNSEVRLNAIKALGCLSEAPEARLALTDRVDMIKSHVTDYIPAVAKAAVRTVEIITWLPGFPNYPSTLPANPYSE